MNIKLTREQLLAAAESLARGANNMHPDHFSSGVLRIQEPGPDGGWRYAFISEDEKGKEYPAYFNSLDDSDVVLRALICSVLSE